MILEREKIGSPTVVVKLRLARLNGIQTIDIFTRSRKLQEEYIFKCWQPAILGGKYFEPNRSAAWETRISGSC
jgi:hypothetical protein